jgi:hypothetical protein
LGEKSKEEVGELIRKQAGCQNHVQPLEPGWSKSAMSGIMEGVSKVHHPYHCYPPMASLPNARRLYTLEARAF